MKDKLIWGLKRFFMVPPFIATVIAVLAKASQAVTVTLGIITGVTILVWIGLMVYMVIKTNKKIMKDREEGKAIATDQNPDDENSH